MELLALVFRIVPKPGAPMEGDFEVLFEDDYLPAPSSQYLLSPHEAVSSRRIGTTSVLSTIFFPKHDTLPEHSRGLSRIYAMCD